MKRSEYDALEGINFSSAKEILRSPAHYQAALAAKALETEEDRKRFIVGSGLHSVVLEEVALSSLYVEKPAGLSFATKEGKAWRAEQKLPIIDGDQIQAIQGMASAIHAHPLARSILARCGEREVGMQANLDGVMCKGLADAIGKDSNGTPILVDLKSTQDARPREFRRRVEWMYHYDYQMEHYKALARNCDRGECSALWIVVESEAPYSVVVYAPGADLVASGHRKLSEVLQTWLRCTETGVWPSYAGSEQITEL